MVEKKRKRSEHAAKRAQVRGEEAWSIAAWSNDEADGTESGSPLCSSNGDNLWRSDDREWIATLETHAACFESPGALAGTSSVDDDDASSLSSGSDCSEPETICEDDAGLTDTEMQAHVADALQRINALYDMGYTTHRERILFVKWTIMFGKALATTSRAVILTMSLSRRSRLFCIVYGDGDGEERTWVMGMFPWVKSEGPAAKLSRGIVPSYQP